MAKFMQILFVAFLAFALCSAEAARNSRSQGRRSRFFARQEIEDVTPYPSADELKPEVPFDEAVAAEEITPNQPEEFAPTLPEDNVHQPDEIYGPPEQEEDLVPVQEEEEEVAVEEAVAGAEEELPARLTARRVAFRRSAVRPAKLRKAAPARLQLQRQFVPQPIFYYISQ